jgi:hypothetical protein
VWPGSADRREEEALWAIAGRADGGGDDDEDNGGGGDEVKAAVV